MLLKPSLQYTSAIQLTVARSNYTTLIRGQSGTGKELGPKPFSQGSITALMQRKWPGNVRELQNLVRRVVLFSEAESIGIDELQVLDNIQRKRAEHYSSNGNYLNDGPIAEYKVVKEEAVQRFTNEYIQRLLKETEGNVSKGA